MKRFITTVVAVLFVFSTGGAADISVNSSALWSTISPVPTSADTVILTNGSILTIDVNTAVCAKLQVAITGGNSASTVTFNPGSMLTVSGDIVLGGAGNRTGSINMTSGGTLRRLRQDLLNMMYRGNNADEGFDYV